MVKIFSIVFTIFAIFPYTPQNAFASDSNQLSFSVSELSLYFEKSEKPIKNITIKNKGKSTLFIVSNIQKVTNNSFDLPSLQNTKEIVITPKNFTIFPKESATFRAVYLPTMSKVESQYQIFLMPFNKDFTKKIGNKSFVINVVADPLTINDDFKFYRVANVITFKNSGNRSVYILNAKTCSDEGCKTVSDIRIPHASELKLNVNDKDYFEFTKKVGNEFEKIRVN